MKPTNPETQAKLERIEAEMLRDFYEQPTTKLTLSLIPPANPPEAVQALVAAAFAHGINCGHALSAVHLLDAFARVMPKPGTEAGQ